MRFRSDSDIRAEYHARHDRGEALALCPCGSADCDEKAQHFLGTPPAEPGDTWRVHWARTVDQVGPPALAGYAICCPKCRLVHLWSSASNCASKNADGGCAHTGVGSCWNWTGSAEDNRLSASPSLYALHACGWHGFLTDGELVGA